MNNFKYFLCFFLPIFLLLLCNEVSAQTLKRIDIRGKIIDEQGEALSAIITVKRTGKSIANDIKGNFLITNIAPDDTLIISGINLQRLEIAVNNRTDLNNIITKSKVVQQEEIMINANTGYQTLKPNEINGAVVLIDNKTLNQQVGTNILERLKGVTSGLSFNNKSNINPQSGLNISIRGLSTINGPLNPVIVLDNFIYEGDINNINPNDIESVTILKDAAATSIYGARGGNGVIVLTSKKGRFNQSLAVEYNSTFKISDKPDLFYLPQISSADYIDVEQFLFRKGYYNSLINYDYYYHTPFTPAVQVFIKAGKGLLSEQDSAKQINALKEKDIRNDYNKYLYRNAFTQQHSVNLHGGGMKNKYFLSINYTNSISDLYATSDKVNLRAGNDFRPFKHFTLSTGVFYTSNTLRSGRPAQVKLGLRDVPYLSLMDGNGNPLTIAPSYGDSYTDTAGNEKLLSWKYYPLDDYKHDKTKTVIEEWLAEIGTNYQITKDLNVDAKYQNERQTILVENTADLDSYSTRDIINRFSQIANGIVDYKIPAGGILRNNNSSIIVQSFRSQLNYQHTWSLHTLSAIAGTEIREVKGSTSSNTIYGYDPEVLTAASVDFFNRYPTYVNGASQSIPGSPSLSGTINRYVSAYANFSYQYRKKYSLSGSARKDGSNIFGANTNDKWKPLWSIGAGWDISGEKFYKLRAISYLRIRASLGISGNVDISKSALPVGRYNTSPFNLPYLRINTINNPSLKWEQSKQLNLGFEFSLLNNILTGSIDYYTKRGSDLYGVTPYDYTTWGAVDQIIKNVANMEGKGVDVILNSKNIDKSFKWTTTFLFNYSNNKTTRYFDEKAEKGLTLIGGNGNTITPAVGYPLYGIAAYKWGGLDDKGDPQGFLNGEKSTDYAAIFEETNLKALKSENVKFIGSAIPLYEGSLINVFNYHQFFASINISYKLGYYFRKPSLSYHALFDFGSSNEDFANRWQHPGDEKFTNVPAMVYTNYPQFTNRETFYSSSEINVLRGDHIRIEYINMGYSFLKGNNNKIFKSLQLYGNIANAGIVWRANKEKIDPDNVNSIPIPTSFSIGIRAAF